MTSTSSSYGYFLQPTQVAEVTNVWHVREKRELEWHYDFPILTLRLGQHGYASLRPRAGRVFLGSTSTPPTKFKWNVDTYEHDKNFSNLYFIFAWNSTNVPVAGEYFNVISVAAFRAPNFIIEPGVFSTLSTVSVPSATSSTLSTPSLPTNTTPLAPIDAVPKSRAVQVAVPVSVVGPLLLAGLLGWFLWRRRRQRNVEAHEMLPPSEHPP